MKTRSPQMMGVAAEEPDKSAVQAMFSVWLQSVGKSVSSVEPLKSGPRQCGHSPAQTKDAPNSAKTRSLECFNMIFPSRVKNVVLLFQKSGAIHRTYILHKDSHCRGKINVQFDFGLIICVSWKFMDEKVRQC